MFRKVLIANRGAIACRVIRTLRKVGVASVAVYSEADRHSLHVDQADEAVCIGPPPAAQSYLSIPSILKAAKETGAEAIHPGYGFLSENAKFAEACAENGIVFIGPTPQQMRDFGLKHSAREIAAKNGVPMLPGTGVLRDVDAALEAAEAVGYPTMLKSTAGGGGIGMRLCSSPDELRDAYEAVSRQSQASFGSSNLYLERFVTAARHIEVQIFGDGRGHLRQLDRRVLLPRGEHAAPSRTRRYRGSYRRRPRRMDGEAGCGRHAAAGKYRGSGDGIVDPGARLRRGSGTELSA